MSTSDPWADAPGAKAAEDSGSQYQAATEPFRPLTPPSFTEVYEAPEDGTTRDHDAGGTPEPFQPAQVDTAQVDTAQVDTTQVAVQPHVEAVYVQPPPAQIPLETLALDPAEKSQATGSDETPLPTPAQPTQLSEPVAVAEPARAPNVDPLPEPDAASQQVATQPATTHPVASQPATTSTRGYLRTRTALLLIAAALVGAAVGAGAVAFADRHDRVLNSGVQVTQQNAPPAAPEDGTITAAAAHVQPSVVTLYVSAGGISDSGSGLIIRSDGYILTNDHVVSAAAKTGTITVVLSDRRSEPAIIVGRDPSDDLAVIRVRGLGPLTAAVFGRSSTLRIGQTVVAIGAPLGLSGTVTSGIVSDLDRPIRSGTQSQAVFDAVQTDAALDPGDSGGPLVDLSGSVVGINSAIAGDTGVGGQSGAAQSGRTGIGFAIGSDEASRIAGELVATGTATHAVLGISVVSAGQGPGVMIRSVTSGGPGAKAGLKVGDVLSAIAGVPVSTPDGVLAAVRAQAPYEKVSVTYVRKNTAAAVRLVLGSSLN
jgi:putative serine protease PepD